MFPTQIQSTVQAQHSRQHLFNTEKMSIGGQFTVRGYQNQAIQGDTGYYWRNDFVMPLWSLFYPWKEVKDWTRSWSFLLGYDVGWVRKNSPNSSDGPAEGFLEGVACGLRYRSSGWHADFIWSGPLRASSYVDQLDTMIFYASVGMTIL